MFRRVSRSGPGRFAAEGRGGPGKPLLPQPGPGSGEGELLAPRGLAGSRGPCGAVR